MMRWMISNLLQIGLTKKVQSYDTQVYGFGYIGQLAGYAKASGKKTGGWWVVNKANEHFSMYLAV